MADFGVLKTIRNLIENHESVQAQGYGQCVRTTQQAGDVPPMILLELEEIWTTMRLGVQAPSARLKLKASIVGKTAASRESIGVADSVRRAMDGQTLSLEEGRQGVIRLENSIIDLPSVNRPRTVQQYYEVLIRG